MRRLMQLVSPWRRRINWALVLLLGACSTAGLLHEGASGHGRIFITEDDAGLRTLTFERGGARQSVVKPDDPRHLELPYARVALAGLALRPLPSRILVIGLGGGSIPRFLHAHLPEATIDVVDIDATVVDAARRFFGLREDERLRIHIEDGRRFIERAPPGAYDLVFLDAFDARTIPPHLTTLEFLRAARNAIQSAGVVVGNIWGPALNPLHDAMLRTYAEAFEEVVVLDVPGDANRIFLALPSKRPVERAELARLARRVSTERSFRFDLGELVLNGFSDDTTAGTGTAVLRDP